MTLGTTHLTLREAVAAEIRGMIMRRELQPGERLLEESLADQLGVSRNPIREAIRALEGAGLVEVRPRRGAYVSQLDPAAAAQLLELRSVIEAYAARLAAQRRTDADLTRIRSSLAAGIAASREGDLVRAAGHHRDFHLAIEEASGNRYLSTVVSPLRHQTELVFSVLADQRGLLSWDEHERILGAIEDADPEAAAERTVEHMRSVIADLAGARQ